jgi:Flp pilus assembly protein TadG
MHIILEYHGALLAAFRKDRRGNVTVIFGFLAIPLIALIGFAVDTSRVNFVRTRAQAAMDSAVLGAVVAPISSQSATATKLFNANVGRLLGLTATPTFTTNADGSLTGSTSVTVPTTFTQVLSHSPFRVKVTSTAASGPGSTYCILALASSGAQEGIRSNGAPFANLGCNIASDTGARCNGHNLGAPIGYAVGTNSGCGSSQLSNRPYMPDLYSDRASNIPANPCGSYPQAPAKKKDPALPSSNEWLGTYTLSGYKVVCGDQQLIGNTTINNTVLVIENGRLDLNGYKLTGSGLTIVFTGTNSTSYQHTVTGGGTLDIAAPTSGVWSGIAIYQDPSLTTNVDISYAGNTPTWQITGLVYLPHSSVTISGAVNKSSQGAYCLGMVVDNLTVNGTGSIFANNTQCPIAGLTLPTDTQGARLTK